MDTFNPKIWSRGATYLRDIGADIVLLQETRMPAAGPPAAAQSARGDKWKVAMAPSQVTTNGGQSAGTAVAVKSHDGLGVSSANQLNFNGDTRPRFVAALVLVLLPHKVWHQCQMQPRLARGYRGCPKRVERAVDLGGGLQLHPPIT